MLRACRVAKSQTPVAYVGIAYVRMIPDEVNCVQALVKSQDKYQTACEVRRRPFAVLFPDGFSAGNDPFLPIAYGSLYGNP